jgi:glucose dehydrogenase
VPLAYMMRTRFYLAAVIAANDHSQYSSLKQINKNNVKQLQVAWM